MIGLSPQYRITVPFKTKINNEIERKEKIHT